MKFFSDNVLWSIVALLATALAITAAVKLSPPPQKISLSLNAACDLNQGPCVASLPGGGRLELSLEPRPIPVLKPLKLQVRTTGFKTGSVEVDFAGVDMKMAFNRPRLVPGKDGLFNGEAALPVCVRDQMAWQATVLVKSDDKRIEVPFRFETKR